MLTFHRRSIVNISHLCDLAQFKYDSALFRSLVINVLCDDGVEQIVISVELFHHVLVEQNFELLADFNQFINVNLGRTVNNGGESLVHVLGCSTYTRVMLTFVLTRISRSE